MIVKIKYVVEKTAVRETTFEAESLEAAQRDFMADSEDGHYNPVTDEYTTVRILDASSGMRLMAEVVELVEGRS